MSEQIMGKEVHCGASLQPLCVEWKLGIVIFNFWISEGLFLKTEDN